MNYHEPGPHGQIVMICQLCNSRCHADRPNRAMVQVEEEGEEGKPVYREVECRKCICHDCVQLSGDPVRAQIAPMMLGQTMEAGENLLTDGTKEKRPGPFKIGSALHDLAGKLGLIGEPSKPKKISQSRECADCGHPAKTKCLDCNGPLCAPCVQGHVCKREERF